MSSTTGKKLSERIPGLTNGYLPHWIVRHSLPPCRAGTQFLQKNRIQCLTYYDEAYPFPFAGGEDSPVGLFFKGNADLNASPYLNMVGTTLPIMERNFALLSFVT